MAAGTPVTIGSATPNSGLGTTITFTTTAVVPSGAVVVICAGFGGVTNTVSGGTAGGLTLTIGSQGPTNTDQFNSVLWADAPSGLASGSTVTVNITGTGGSSRYCQGSYVTGLQTGGPSAVATADSTTAAAWATGTVSVPTGDILIGSCMAHKKTLSCRVARQSRRRARSGRAAAPQPKSPGQAKAQARTKSKVRRQRHTQQPQSPKGKAHLKRQKQAGARPKNRCQQAKAPAPENG